jgi:hypothetical protein
MFPTSSDGTCDVSNTAVERDIIVIEEHSMVLNKEAPISIKQEEIPEGISYPDIQAGPDEVSYLCVCLLVDTFYHCPEISVVFVMSIFLANGYSCMVGKEDIFFYPCRKISIFSGCFLKTRPI